MRFSSPSWSSSGPACGALWAAVLRDRVGRGAEEAEISSGRRTRRSSSRGAAGIRLRDDMHHEELLALPPVPWVRERDVDLLIAGLLVAEVEFIAWLVARPSTSRIAVPAGVPEHVHAVVNYSRPTASSSAAGETDVLASATYPNGGGELVVSIEDKVWATPQASQGERHRRFIEECESTWRLSVLIAPSVWIASHPSEVGQYHLAVSLEDVAAWCRGRCLTFQAAVFDQACKPPMIELAPDLQEWHASTGALLERHLGLRLAPQQRVRTRNPGQAKTNRWTSCASETLIQPVGAEQPWLYLRPSSANHTSRAAIDLPKAPPDLIEQVRRDAVGRGFEVRITAARTLIVERLVPDAQSWSLASPFDEQVQHLLAVGAAGVLLRDWWNDLIDHRERSGR